MSNSISREQRAMIWLFGLAVFCGLLYMLSGVLLPFVAGLGVAYFFDPVADRLEESGLSRGAAAGLIVRRLRVKNTRHKTGFFDRAHKGIGSSRAC